MHILVEESAPNSDVHVVTVNERRAGVVQKRNETWWVSVRFIDGNAIEGEMPTLLSGITAILLCSSMTRAEFVRWEPAKGRDDAPDRRQRGRAVPPI